MAEGAGPAAVVAGQTATTWRLALFALAVAAWLAGFTILLRLGTWTPFAVMGPALAAVALRLDAETRALLRPSFAKAGAGLAAGLLMIALTHAAFSLVAPLYAGVEVATARLYEILNVGGFSPAQRAALVVVIAGSEEIIFRGAVLGRAATPHGGPFHGVDRGDLLRVLVSAACYALAMITLGSALLIACAFGCAVLWGGLRVATRSLIAPIAAHVIWDLGVLVVWPLV